MTRGSRRGRSDPYPLLTVPRRHARTRVLAGILAWPCFPTMPLALRARLFSTAVRAVTNLPHAVELVCDGSTIGHPIRPTDGPRRHGGRLCATIPTRSTGVSHHAGRTAANGSWPSAQRRAARDRARILTRQAS